MIIDEQLYKEGSVWSQISCKCDYCGETFLRSKRNIKVGRNIIDKESCNSKQCAKSKREESQLIKYGVKNAGGSEQSIEKSKETWMKNYGVDNPAKSESIKNKIKKTCIDRFGKESFLATDICRKNLKDYSLKNFGVENISQSEVIKQKAKDTCLKKYGVEHPRKNEEILQKYIDSFFEKHGVSFPSQLENHLEKKQKTCIEKYGFDHAVKNKDVQEKIKQTCIERYGKYPVNCFGKTENDISSFIRSLGFNCTSDRSLLEGKEIDIYVPDKKVGIEYCGLFWHNEMSPCPRNRNYHYDKYFKLKQKGIRLITIFEDEWLKKEHICKNIISSSLGCYQERLYARNTEVYKIDKKIAKKFLDNNHIQGGRVNFDFSYGLFKDNEILSVITCGKHHRKNDGYILSRFCTKKGMQIIGGMSRLFEYMKKDIPKGAEIITWSDNRWSFGHIYETLGFKVSKQLDPDYSYYKYGSVGIRKSKQSMKKSNINCPVNMTEREWCLQNDYVRIWDCGKITWSFVNK